MATNSSGPNAPSGRSHGQGPDTGVDKQQQQAAAIINKLKTDLEDSNRKLQETNASLQALTAQQKKSATSLEAEVKRSQGLRAELDSKEARVQELLRQLGEYRQAAQDKAGSQDNLAREGKVKNRVENVALIVGSLALPAGLIVTKIIEQSGGAGSTALSAGLAVSSVGVGTLITVGALKVATRACACTPGTAAGGGKPGAKR